MKKITNPYIKVGIKYFFLVLFILLCFIIADTFLNRKNISESNSEVFNDNFNKNLDYQNIKEFVKTYYLKTSTGDKEIFKLKYSENYNQTTGTYEIDNKKDVHEEIFNRNLIENDKYIIFPDFSTSDYYVSSTIQILLYTKATKSIEYSTIPNTGAPYVGKSEFINDNLVKIRFFESEDIFNISTGEFGGYFQVSKLSNGDYLLSKPERVNTTESKISWYYLYTSTSEIKYLTFHPLYENHPYSFISSTDYENKLYGALVKQNLNINYTEPKYTAELFYIDLTTFQKTTIKEIDSIDWQGLSFSSVGDIQVFDGSIYFVYGGLNGNFTIYDIKSDTFSKVTSDFIRSKQPEYIEELLPEVDYNNSEYIFSIETEIVE